MAGLDLSQPLAGLRYQKRPDGIALITLDRPAKGNSLAPSMIDRAALRRCAVSSTSTGGLPAPAPMAFFPFSGWKDSFFGDMHGQGMDAVEFFTQKKVVVERWPKEWTRKF